MMALKSAELSELAFPRITYDGVLAWFNEVSDEKGRAGYTARGTGKVFRPGACENFDHHETMTAVTVLGRIFIQKRKNDPALNGVNLLTADLPTRWATRSTSTTGTSGRWRSSSTTGRKVRCGRSGTSR
jgi:hypothetical protein